MEYLLDTNVLIYYINRIPKILKFLKALKKDYFFISTVTCFEVLMGAKNEKEFTALDEILRDFAPLDLKTETARIGVRLHRANQKKLKWRDLLIAATVKAENLTLVTADKDFQKVKGLNVKLVLAPLPGPATCRK